MKKKSFKLTKEQNENRLRIIIRFLIIISVLVTIGATLIGLNLFVRDLYISFVLDFIGTSFLFATALAVLLFFLYLVFVITAFNPQGLKKSSVIKFAFGGVFTLIITIFLFNFTITEAIKSIQDMSDYSNGDWQVKDLFVTDVYRGSGLSDIVLIETDEGEMILHWESFRIYTGEKYRFTYLDATNTIIKVEKVTDLSGNKRLVPL